MGRRRITWIDYRTQHAQRIAHVLRGVREGWTLREIAAAAGCSHELVRLIMRRGSWRTLHRMRRRQVIERRRHEPRRLWLKFLRRRIPARRAAWQRLVRDLRGRKFSITVSNDECRAEGIAIRLHFPRVSVRMGSSRAQRYFNVGCHASTAPALHVAFLPGRRTGFVYLPQTTTVWLPNQPGCTRWPTPLGLLRAAQQARAWAWEPGRGVDGRAIRRRK